MKNTSIIAFCCLFITFFLASCGNSTTQVLEFNNLEASGEFLFEGPNTLQGDFSITEEGIAQKLAVSPEKILEVQIEAIQVQLPSDSSYMKIESLLVQVVSNENPLVTLGTISPLAADLDQSLSVNKEIDITPYLRSDNSTLVVDTNLKADADELKVVVKIDISVKFKE